MPQADYRVNLSAAIYPMTLAKSGRSVVNPGRDQNFDKRVDASGNDKGSVGIPQAIYMENVFPTPEGFQSIGFKPVGGIAGGATELVAVERIRLALNVDTTTVDSEDIDYEDPGTQASDWTFTPDGVFYGNVPDIADGSYGYISGNANHGALDLAFTEQYAAMTFPTGVSGAGVAYRLFGMHFVDTRPLTGGNFDILAGIAQDFGHGAATAITFSCEVIFQESMNEISSSFPDKYPEKTFIVGVDNTSGGAGVKVYYSSLTNQLSLCNYTGYVETGRAIQFAGAVPALNFDETYTLTVTVTIDGLGNRTYNAQLLDDTDAVIAGVAGLYTSASVTGGGNLVIGRQPVSTGMVVTAEDGVTYSFGPMSTWVKNIAFAAVMPDTSSTTTKVSGLSNVDLAFDVTGNNVSWSLSTSEDWQNNPVSFADPLLIENGTQFSTATVRGICYVCLRTAGVTKIYRLSFLPVPDEDTILFTDVTETIGETFSTLYTTDDIVSISGSFNYLLLHTSTVVFWSSTTTPEDFAASLVSGAGSETPNNLKGDIRFVKEHVAGFYLYSTNNVVFAAYTGNRAYPWKFREIGGSGGFNYSSQVSGDTNAQIHYGLNNARFIQLLAPDEAKVQSPEVTDFLERVRKWDIFNSGSNTFTTSTDSNPNGPTPLIKSAEPRIWYVLDRYILVPYGVTGSEGSYQYTYCLVYDSLLGRYGKIKLTFDGITTDETNIYFVNFQDLTRKKLFFDMRNREDGEDDYPHEGVLLLGKYEWDRGRMIQLEGVEVESALSEISGAFTAHLLPSLNGKTFNAAVPLVRIAETTNELARFPAHTVGQNVSLLLKGAFDLCSVQITGQDAGKAT